MDRFKSQSQDAKLNFDAFKDIKKITSSPNSILPQNIKNADFIDLTIWAIRNKDLTNVDFISLIDNFLDKGSISFLISEANKGKTFLSLAICKYLLEFDKVKKIVYFDGDNSKITIKSRIK
ncbi:hypothetical protein [Campylobacter lari]|nr:hypothetical protein [Campylobacter lari]